MKIHIKKNNFDIDIAISEFIIFYNNSFNNVTKRIPIDIKDLTNVEEITEINKNIIKSMSRKLKFEQNVFEKDYLLLNDNIKLNNNVININYRKRKCNYIIPCRFISYVNNNLFKIVVDIDYYDILVKDQLYDCEAELLNIVQEFAYNYYLKYSKFANNLIINEESKDA